MVRFIHNLLLFGALATAVPTDVRPLSDHSQHVLVSDPQEQRQPRGNPRKLRGRFLHITDFHPDPFYLQGREPDGSHPCHRGNDKGSNVTGLYGAPLTDCDTPFTLVNATFEWIKENVKDEIDFIVWTGDSARHDNDDNIPRSTLQIQSLNKFIVHKFREVFGKSDNLNDPDPTNDFVIPIVPTYGNNDILPHNIFLPGPNSWTRDFIDIWKEFIPQEQKHSFARGGWFWSEVIPNKLAIISLNTLYFFENNGAVDGCNLRSEPGYEHMEWLRIQLQFMRQRGMKAFFIGHVPPARTENKQSWDETCYQKYVLWQRQYRDVIVANIFGHMNIDHFMFHDTQDLAYDFAIEGIDDEGLERDMSGLMSNSREDVHIAGKATYLGELRDAWSALPDPPKGLRYGSLEEDEDDAMEIDKNKKHKKGQKGKKDKKQKSRETFLRQLGGKYGERYAMSLVSPSIVPNFFPSLRIIEYNITGLENDHPASTGPIGHLATEADLHHHKNPHTFEDIEENLLVDDEAEVAQKPTKKKPGKKPKKPTKPKPDFPVPAPPSKKAPPGPAYSPQTFSLLSWKQLHANLTKIHQEIAEDSIFLEDDEEQVSRHVKNKYFQYTLEYSTNNDTSYKMPDLTVIHWLGLAERIGRTRFKKNDIDVNDITKTNDLDELLVSQGDTEDDDDDEIEIDKKKKKKKKKHHKDKHKKSYGSLKDNELWHEFIRRAYVHAKPDADLEDDFG